MFEFPELTGHYGVGTKLYHWVDPSRKEKFNPGQSNQRELLVQIWYPSQTNNLKTVQYASELSTAWKEGLQKSGYPESQLNEIDKVCVHGVPNAPILADDRPYPVIIFSHGYVAFRTAYTAYCEELASQGYIVVAIGHTYYAALTIFPDQRIIPALTEHCHQTKLCDEATSEEDQELWLADARFVLEKLTQENNSPNSMLYQCLDLQNIGAFGHSFGGSTAVQLGRNDSRCKAVVNLDGGLFGKKATQGFEKPLMIIVGKLSWKSFDDYPDEALASFMGFPQKLIAVLRLKYRKYIPQLLQEQKCDNYFIEIENANHAAFSDWVLLKSMPLYQLNKNIFNLENLTGEVDGLKMTANVNKHLTNFFNCYLKKDKP